MANTVKNKPNKPYPSFPLTAHPNGQWCKKIRGKIHFFGVWGDPEAAHNAYLASAADLHAGRLPQPSTVSNDSLTVKQTCNAYLNWQKGKMQGGDIGATWYEDCRVIIRDFSRSMGHNRVISDLRAEDFQRYRNRRAKEIGVHALTREITTIRSMFKYAYESDLIEVFRITSDRTTEPSLRPIPCGNGWRRWASEHCSSSRGALGRTDASSRSMVSCGTRCSTAPRAPTRSWMTALVRSPFSTSAS